MENKKWVTSSEIGNYIYCQRSWWYKINGKEINNYGKTLLDEGRANHDLTYNTYSSITNIFRIAFIILIVSFVLVIFAILLNHLHI